MDTNVLTPQKVFYLPQYLMVPLFQRPYVWQETDQWQPLWQDIARIAELRSRDPHGNAQHFLGAVVLQANEVAHGSMPTKNVIDGQQRLTSLQLLVDATSGVLRELGIEGLALQLDELTRNRSYDPTAEPTLKLMHSNRDREAFLEVMNTDAPIDYGDLTHSGSLIAGAHEYFSRSVDEWLAGVDGEVDQARATTLVHVISHGLQIVVIDLQAQENSQEIFETLNARGTPLTAADLIKNYVFQRLNAEGVDTAKAYAEDWPFETEFWEETVSVGRVAMTRGSLFLGQWLAARLGEEISPRQTFSRFKHHVEYEADSTMSELLSAIKAQADAYQRWTVNAADSTRLLSVTELAVYRMQCAGMELLKPVLIWVHDPALNIGPEVAEEVIGHFESWVTRRQLLRLTTAQLGSVVSAVIRAYRSAPAAELGARVSAHLARLSVASTYWPGDDELRAHLRTEQVYRRFQRPRLRMYLEAIEDNRRGRHDYPAMYRKNYPIEHLLPQKWQTHWPVSGLEAEVARSEHVHRFGNLTLLSTSLNSSVSNGPWAGEKGKRSQILAHDVFLINRPLHDAHEWDEAAIDARTESMIDALLATWPVPDGHQGTISDPESKSQTWVEIKHLVAAGLLATGATLRRNGDDSIIARITDQARIEVDGHMFDTPTGAARHVRDGRHTNGWTYWYLDDGRRLYDVRAAFRGDTVTDQPTFDWSVLHQILEQLPEGRWTSYGELADAIGTAPQPLGNHIANCRHCVNAWRVLSSGGQIAPGFGWHDPHDARDPIDVLQHEGVAFNDGKATPERQLGSEELAALTQSRTT